MDFKSIVERLKELLIQNKWTIATAESLTAGLVASNLASISGSSGYLKGGIVAYTIPIKAQLLGVDQEMAEKCNAYAPEVAEQMVKGICEKFSTDLGIATTGFAEPSPDDSIFVPQAYVAISIHQKIKITQIMAPDRSRNEVRAYIAEQAIAFLLKELEDLHMPSQSSEE